MTPQEVVWFFNHKYGEKAYVIENDTHVHIFTPKSKWQIIKADYPRFKEYTLYHWSTKAGKGYHKQMKGRNLDYLVFCACFHDEEKCVFPRDFTEFRRRWDLYNYGQQLAESCMRFAWLSGEEFHNDEC